MLLSCFIICSSSSFRYSSTIPASFELVALLDLLDQRCLQLVIVYSPPCRITVGRRNEGRHEGAHNLVEHAEKTVLDEPLVQSLFIL